MNTKRWGFNRMTAELSKVIVGLAWPVVVLTLALIYKREILSL